MRQNTACPSAAARCSARHLCEASARLYVDGFDKADRYTTVGPGIPPGAKPLGDQILLPGKGIDGNQIIDTGGRSRWKIYWRDTGVDYGARLQHHLALPRGSVS